MKARLDDTRKWATFQAYQTVRISVMTRAKGRMPDFRTLLDRSSENTIDARTSPQKADAVMQLIAARAGTTVKPINRNRIVRH